MQHILYKNAKIAFSDFGHGDAIILLHGFLENSLMWQFFIADFAASKRVVCIDLLGHGQSDSLGYLHTMSENAAVVYQVLKFLGIQKCSFVGHSMGGYVSLAFAAAHPSFIQKLVLLNSTSEADSTEKKLNRDRAIAVVKKDHTSFVRMAITNLFATKNRETLAEVIEYTKTEALKTSLQGIVASLEGMKIRADYTDLFKKMEAKKLLILGINDAVLDFETAKKQVQNTNIQLITMPDGHMSHLENTDQLKKVFQVFFE